MTAVEAILAARAQAAVAPDVARRIASATGGNALAVVELAPLLTREQLAGGEPLPQPLPMSAGVQRLFVTCPGPAARDPVAAVGRGR